MVVAIRDEAGVVGVSANTVVSGGERDILVVEKMFLGNGFVVEEPVSES